MTHDKTEVSLKIHCRVLYLALRFITVLSEIEILVAMLQRTLKYLREYSQFMKVKTSISVSMRKIKRICIVSPYYQDHFMKNSGAFGSEINNSCSQNVTNLLYSKKTVKYFRLVFFIIVSVNSYRIPTFYG